MTTQIPARYTIKRTIVQCGAVESIKYTYGTIEELNLFHECNAMTVEEIIAELHAEAELKFNDGNFQKYVYTVVPTAEPFLAFEAMGITV